MTDPVTSAVELLRLLVKEGRHRVLALSAVFSVIALGSLAAGVLMPKQYEAQTILLVDSKNPIAPLMAGRVQPTGTEDAQVVRQAFLSRRILREVLVFGGWGEFKDPVEEARMMSRLAGRITIQSPRRELVRITYRDSDPKRCYEVTARLAELYIRESTVGKGRASKDAFEFIDKQVQEYAAKVEQAHAKVLAYTRGRAAPGEAAPAPRREPPRRAAPRLTPEELAALTVEEASIAAELASAEARGGSQRRAERTAELERELERLLTTYTENHPNVKRAREELRIQRLEAERVAATDDQATASIRRRLEQVRRQIAAASEAAHRATAAEAEVPPELRGVGQDSTLSELVRRYEASRQVYQDLLERRENARVSLELEAEQGSDSVRVYEQAEVPVIATGLRLMHVSLLGIALGVMVPVGLLYALLRLDPRVRSPRQLERLAHVPLLVGIPYAPTLRERLRQRRHALLAAGMVVVVFATYAAFFVVRVKLAS